MSDSQKWFVLAVLLTAAALLYLLAPILTPFVIAALLAYLGDPLADRLQKLKMPRSMAVVVVFVTIFIALGAILLLLVPIIGNQLAGLIGAIPDYVERLNRIVTPWLERNFDLEGPMLDPDNIQKMVVDNWEEAGGVATYVLTTVTRSGMVLFAWLVNLVLIPVVTFYLLRDWDRLTARLRGLLPRDIEPTVTRLAHESDEVLGGFLKGQLLVMIALGAIYSVGLWWIGLEFALIIGILAGLVSFVPYLGPIVGVLIAGAAMFLQTQELLQLLLVGVVFGVGQLVEGMLLTPVLVGDRIGLHPVVVIFAVLAGGQLFGFFGVLLALPTAAVLAVLARYWVDRYVHSRLYDQEGGRGAHP